MPELNLEDVKKSVEGINKAFEDFKAANDQKIDDLATKGAVDVLVDEKLVKINDAMTKHQTRLDEWELSQKRQSMTYVDKDGNEIDLDAKAQKWAETRGHRGEFNHEGMTEYKNKFDQYLKKGDQIMGADELKALSVGSDPDGGYTVHPDMGGSISKKIFDTSPMRAYASVQVIGTDALEGMYDDDEAGASWVGETASRSETDTPEMGVWRIPVHELTASPKATQKLLDDSSINIETWLAENVSSRMSRKEATAFVTGTGVNQPRGFTTYADGTSIREQVKQHDTGVNGDFPAAPAGGDVLITALYDLKSAYRARASWFMNRSTMAATRKEKDSDGAYLWSPGIAAGQPATLLGYPVAPAFEDMADIATGSLSIAVGDMASAYQIVERQGTRVLRDPYTSKPYVIFYTVRRVGGGLINGEAIKLINFQA